MKPGRLNRSVAVALLLIGCGGKLVVDQRSDQQDDPSMSGGSSSGGSSQPTEEAGTRAMSGGFAGRNDGGMSQGGADFGGATSSAGSSITSGGSAAEGGAAGTATLGGQGGHGGVVEVGGEGGVSAGGSAGDSGGAGNGGEVGAGGARELGEECHADLVCVSGACDFEAHQCVADACKDHHQDGGESDADCGGADCNKCGLGQGCNDDQDCTTNACDGVKHVCVPNQCIDHRTDGNETDVDCGGINNCARCIVGQHCNFNFDCQAGHKCDMAANPKLCAPY